MAGNIFINYRREESAHTAGRLHDSLAPKLGRNKLFMDVDNIPIGKDFDQYLKSQVAACDAMLTIIGPNWLAMKDETGKRRLDNPEDYVAIEIRAALARDIPVVPVLVDGARMPKMGELPDSLKLLANRQAVEVRHTNFNSDAETLVKRLREVLGYESPGRRWRVRAIGIAAVAVLLLLIGWGGYAFFRHTLEQGVEQLYRRAAEVEANRKITVKAEQERQDAATAKEIAVLRLLDDVWSAAFSPEGSRIVTASSDKTARIWDAATAKEIAVLRGHDSALWSAAFSPDGSRIVTASSDKTARIWVAASSTASSKEIVILRGHDSAVTSAAFSPDGSRIVTASYDKTARIWDAASGKEIAVLRGHDNVVRSAAFSPDGSRIITASYDKTARIWEAATAKEIAVLRGYDSAVTSAAFSPDGSRIVTASEDKTARIWDAATAKEIVVLRGHDSAVTSAAFSPDGSRIVTASSDKTARIWDAATAKEIAVLRGHDSALWSAAFSPGGSRIITASEDKTARIWRLEVEAKHLRMPLQ